MKLILPVLAVSLTALLAGCVIIDAERNDMTARYSGDAERVYSANIGADAITLRVAASGCTTKEFFNADIDHLGGEKFSVEFERTRRDYCKMLQPEGETLSWSFSELGLPAGAVIVLENPVGR